VDKLAMRFPIYPFFCLTNQPKPRKSKDSVLRIFFCQIEAVETVIWLTEVAPKLGNTGKKFIEHLYPYIITLLTHSNSSNIIMAL